MVWINNLQMLDTLISLVSFLVSSALFVFVYFDSRKKRKALRECAAGYPGIERFKEDYTKYRDINTLNPWILHVNLLPHQVSSINDIRLFYRNTGQKIPEKNLSEILMPGIMKVPDDIETLINELRKARHEMDINIATEVHVFVAGPIGAALYIGAQLDNWKMVKVFQMNQATRQYEFWGLLQK